MISTHKTLLLATMMAAVPALASATPASPAMDGCVSAFMQSLAKHTAPLKLHESRFLHEGVMPSSSTELVLIATDAHDNHRIGQAICKVDPHGQVLQLEEVSLRSLPPL
jgi:hypothetical protein